MGGASVYCSMSHTPSMWSETQVERKVKMRAMVLALACGHIVMDLVFF